MPFLFCCGGGGSRQVKTRQDFAAAHSGFVGDVMDGQVTLPGGRQSRTRSRSSSATGSARRSDRETEESTSGDSIAAVPTTMTEDLGRASPARCVQSPLAPRLRHEEYPVPPRAPVLAPNISDLTKPLPDVAALSHLHPLQTAGGKPNCSQRPSWFKESISPTKRKVLYDHDVEANASVRPAWINGNHDDVEGAPGIDAALRSRRPEWEDDPSDQPGDLGETESATGDSVSTGSVRGGWEKELESMGLARRLGRVLKPQISAANGAQPGWAETDSMASGLPQPGWARNGSMDCESVRPAWMGDTRSVAADSVRLRWPGGTETESIATESVQHYWTDTDETTSQRPQWINGTATPSIASHSNSNWRGRGKFSSLSDDGRSIAGTKFDDDGKSQRSGWTGGGATPSVHSQRPRWINRGRHRSTSFSDDDLPLRRPGANGNHEYLAGGLYHFRAGGIDPAVEQARANRVRQPRWKGNDGQRSEARDDRVYRLATKGERTHPTSPTGTMGGQSSSEDALRPLSELADPATERRRRITSKTNGSEMGGPPVKHPSEDGGLLDLIVTTDEKEHHRRRMEKLQSEGRGRRMYFSSPGERTRKETDERLRQQPPRQPTAEITVVRPKPLPPADSGGKAPTAVRKDRRERQPFTPTHASATAAQQPKEALPPSPATAQIKSRSRDISPASAARASPANRGVALTTPGATDRSSSGSTFRRPPSPSAGVNGVARPTPALATTSGNKAVSRQAVPLHGPKAPREGSGSAGTTPRQASGQSTPGAAGGAPESFTSRSMWQMSPARAPSGKSPVSGMNSSSPARNMGSLSPGADRRTRVSSPLRGARGPSSVKIRGASPNSTNGASPTIMRGSSPTPGGRACVERGRGNQALASSPLPPATGKTPVRRQGIVRFEGIDSSDSDESALAINKNAMPESPRNRPSSIAEVSSEPTFALGGWDGRAPDVPRDPPRHGNLKAPKAKPSPQAAATVLSCSPSTSSRKPFSRDSPARRSNESTRSSSSSAESKTKSGFRTLDHISWGGGQASEPPHTVRVVSTPSRPGPIAGGGGNAAESLSGRREVNGGKGAPPPSPTMWPTQPGKEKRREALATAAGKADALAQKCPGRRYDAPSPSAQEEKVPLAKPVVGGGGGGAVLSSSKQIQPAGRQRGRQPPKLGTPGQRPKTTRQPPRRRSTPELEPLKEEAPPVSPRLSDADLSDAEARRPPASPSTPSQKSSESNEDMEGLVEEAKPHVDVLGLMKAANTTAVLTSVTASVKVEVEALLPTTEPEATKPPAAVSPHRCTPLRVDGLLPLPGRVSGGKSIAGEGDEAIAGTKWLEERRKRMPLGRDDSNRSSRRNCPWLSRSSSMDDGSFSSSFHDRLAMFSPDRFNPAGGALSWGGSLDESWCNESLRSLMSARGPSDRKLAPQLSNLEKQAVGRLKIDPADVNSGYRPVGGSKRVYKIELNGEMRAAKKLNILGMPKDVVADVLETFDAELLALSRFNTPTIVKVYGASVSPAEITVVSEFVEGGTLRDLLSHDRKQKDLNARTRLSIAQDVAEGMKCLYAHGMQHRSLSSTAILLTHDWRAKITGVGLSMTTEMISVFNGDELTKEEAAIGLLGASRELVAGAGFSEKSDVYSFGILLWEIMQEDGSLPYAGMQPSDIRAAKYNGNGPPIARDCPPAIKSLMERCWSNHPDHRPSFDKICEILEGVDMGAMPVP